MSVANVAVKRADRRIPQGGGYLGDGELAALTPAALCERVRALQPLIAEHAAEAERLRRPHDAVWAALRECGFFYQFVPKEFGGMESDFDTFIDVGMAIAEVDASTAWTATFCAEHNWIFTHFPVETQRELWAGEFPYIIAPVVSVPPGKAVEVEGGYRVSAHWKWGTGVMHADWVMGNALLMREGHPPEMMIVAIPADQVEVLDTWNACGMAGTGSNDIVVKDVFVPRRFAALGIARGGSAPAQRHHANPIYGVPMLPFLAMSAAIPAAGAARGMVNLFRERMAAFARPGAESAMAEKAPPQIRLARADMLARSAEILIREAGRRLLDVPALPEPQRTNERLALRAQIAQAVILCRDAAMTLVEGAGTSILLLDQPFQRAMRDILVVSSHIVFDIDIAMEQHGRGLLGLAPNTPLN